MTHELVFPDGTRTTSLGVLNFQCAGSEVDSKYE
jgi:hypothetical protein